MSIPSANFEEFSRELPKTGKVKDLVSAADFEKAKSDIREQLNGQLADKLKLADLWLDTDTFKTVSVSEQNNSFNKTTYADFERAAKKLLESSKASVAVLPETN